MQTPLEIENYIIDEIFVKANPKFNNSRPSKIGINTRSEIRQKKDNSLGFLICIVINIGDTTPEATNNPYNLKMAIRGYFNFIEGTATELVDKMLVNNGLSILYGIGRGIIAQVTANGPHGKFILPVANLTHSLDHGRSQKSATAKKRLSRNKKK